MSAILDRILRSNFRCGRMLNSRTIGMGERLGMSADRSF